MRHKKTSNPLFVLVETRRRPDAWPPPSLKEPQQPEKRVERKWRSHGWAVMFAMGLAAVLLSLPPCSTARAQAQEEDDLRSGALLFKSDRGMTPAPHVHTAVAMQVSGVIARVEVEQKFTNPSDEWVEGVYAFPLPDNSAVTELHMNVGERIIVGEIREKVQAQQLFDQAKANGQRASVVHQQRPNIFRTAVANIGPSQSIAIKISYLQIVDQQLGRYSLRFPLTITPRYLPGVAPDSALHATSETPVRDLTEAVPLSDEARVGDLHPQLAEANVARQSVSFDIDLDAGVAIDNLASAYHRIDVTGEGRHRRIRLADERAAPDHDFELQWTPLVSGAPAAALFREHTEAGEHLLLMFMPPQTSIPVSLPRDMIFIIDTSGSMGGESIRQARSALLHGLGTLTSADRFNIIQFNSVHETLFDAPVEAREDQLRTARRYVNGLTADGGTEMLPALFAALSTRTTPGYLRQIVFITDGAVGNEEQLMSMIDGQLGDARLFTVGIGSAPNGHFMRKAAQMGRGTFTYIGSIDEVDQRMSELFSKLSKPVLTDIRLQWPAGANPEYAPHHIGDLYADEPIVVSVRLADYAKGALAISGKTHTSWSREIALDQSETRSGVATLWARRKIEDLMDARARGDAEDAVRAKVLPLALQYQLVSNYTSLVAIDKTPVRPGAEPLNSTRIANTKPQGSDWPTAGAPSTATNAQLQLLLGVGCLLFAFGLLRMRSIGSVRA